MSWIEEQDLEVMLETRKKKGKLPSRPLTEIGYLQGRLFEDRAKLKIIVETENKFGVDLKVQKFTVQRMIEELEKAIG